jgi:hypothetical protein
MFPIISDLYLGKINFPCAYLQILRETNKLDYDLSNLQKHHILEALYQCVGRGIRPYDVNERIEEIIRERY